MLSDNYRILERFGAARPRRFGDVYLVESIQTGQKAVLKVVNKTSVDLVALERLRNEAHYSFSTDGLPRIVDFSEDASIAYLVRDFVAGEPIDTFWKKLKKKEQLPFIIQFLKALAPLLTVLHEKRIVHADIKPGNIIISQRSEGIGVALLDFGLALHLDAIEERKLLFPLGYAAPELILNVLNCVDHRTDYFAIGVLIWRLFAGKMPLIHPNPSIFTNLQITHPLPDHSSLPKGLYPLLAKLTNKHTFEVPPNKLPRNEVAEKLVAARNRRYDDLSDFISDLEKLKNRRYWF